MTIKIANKTLELSPRMAKDDWALKNWFKKQTDQTDAVVSMTFMAYAIYQSLKATQRRLGFFKGFKYRFFTFNRVQKSLTNDEVVKYFFQVDELEGGFLKKKMMETASQFQETRSDTESVQPSESR